MGSSVEETAWAVEALASRPVEEVPGTHTSLRRGVRWLIEHVESGQWTRAAPVGFYFARLWYYERLYPLIFTVGALTKASIVLAATDAGKAVPPPA